MSRIDVIDNLVVSLVTPREGRDQTDFGAQVLGWIRG
jgi:hypothetical protein